MVADGPFRYRGFSSPNYTQVPDDVMDVLMPELSGAELKVLLYIIRRTFGFKKQADAISLNQIMNGITTGSGRVLDRGTGLSESTVLSALKGLIAKDVIVAERRRSATKGDQPTIYSLHMVDSEDALPENQGRVPQALPENQGRGDAEIGDPPPWLSGTQETVEQQTEGQDRSRLRTADTTDYDESRDVLLPLVEDIAKEFRDAAPVSSTLTRVVRIQRESGLDDDAFIGRLYRSRQIAKERTSTVTTGEPGRKNLVPYWLAILEDLAKPA